MNRILLGLGWLMICFQLAAAYPSTAKSTESKSMLQNIERQIYSLPIDQPALSGPLTLSNGKVLTIQDTQSNAIEKRQGQSISGQAEQIGVSIGSQIGIAIGSGIVGQTLGPTVGEPIGKVCNQQMKHISLILISSSRPSVRGSERQLEML